MPKKSTRTSKLQLPSPPKVTVENYAPLAMACMRVIEKILGLKLKLAERRATGNRTICEFTGVEARKAEAKYTYSVVPFLQLGLRQFWLAVALEFEFHQGVYDLANVSMLVFEGEAYDERKSALMRAEWDCNQPKTPPAHAQPHWHIYPSRLSKQIEEDRAEFGEKSEAVAFVPEVDGVDSNSERNLKWDRAERFHFAMSARWANEGNESHVAEMTSGGLLKWLEGCLRYIRSEFEYLYA